MWWMFSGQTIGLQTYSWDQIKAVHVNTFKYGMYPMHTHIEVTNTLLNKLI